MVNVRHKRDDFRLSIVREMTHLTIKLTVTMTKNDLK
jgi:hypothetical protein